MAGKVRTIAVAGRGAAVTAVMQQLAALPGVGCVRQIGVLETSGAGRQLAGVDLLVEMAGGVAPAFQTAMTAMGQGVAVVTANPLLMASSGRVLRNASAGQQVFFGFQAAGFGMPVAEVMAAVRPRKVTASFSSVASMALARMVFRDETLGTISAHFKMQNLDLSDWGGKVTQARALALRAQWHADDLQGAQLLRVGVEQVEPADVRRLRGFGLQPVYGTEITAAGLYTGPLAVAPNSPLLGTQAQDVLMAETQQGELVLSCSAEETQRLVAGVVADVRTYLRSSRPMVAPEVREYGAAAASEPVRAYVRLPYGAREEVLAVKPEILSERVDGDGLWQAVVAVEHLREIQVAALGGAVFPLAGAWEAPVAGALRLVG